MLDQVVESCVSGVGVDVNTASPKLLQYVAGVGASLADGIVKHRTEKGPFKSRKALLEVPRKEPGGSKYTSGSVLVVGGSMAGSWDLFEPWLREGLGAVDVPIRVSQDAERAGLTGAALTARR